MVYMENTAAENESVNMDSPLSVLTLFHRKCRTFLRLIQKIVVYSDSFSTYPALLVYANVLYESYLQIGTILHWLHRNICKGKMP